MTDGPRLPIQHDESDPELAELFNKAGRRADGQVLNIFGALANHPAMLRRWLVFAAHVLAKSSLPERDRELLILRTGWNCTSKYEFGQHVLIARRCGISDAEIEAVKAGPDDASWSAHDRTLLTAADELHHDAKISDATWAALASAYDPHQLLDAVAAVGNYHIVSMFLNTLQVPLDPGVPDVDMTE
jgi:alkylhydroperoxidase family enzyme